MIKAAEIPLWIIKGVMKFHLKLRNYVQLMTTGYASVAVLFCDANPDACAPVDDLTSIYILATLMHSEGLNTSR